MLKQNKYNAKNTIQIPFRLNRRTDADIIGFIEVLKKHNIPIAGYIKRIFRQDIESISYNLEYEIEKCIIGNDPKITEDYYRFCLDIKNFLKDIKEI